MIGNYTNKNNAFTVLELLLVIGILAILAMAIIIVLRPVEFLKQTRDARRINDLGVINSALNLTLITSPGSIDWDGPLFSNTCYGESNQKVYVSVPADNGETPPSLPVGWSWAQVSSTDLYRIDGNGWIPMNFGVGGSGLGAKFPVLPIDPVNTFASGQYFTYVCDPELTTGLESDKMKPYLLSDGGDDVNSYETGNKLYITPLRNTSSTQIAGLVAAYGFNESSGATTSDESGNSNTGTLFGGASFVSGQAGHGNAVSLDGGINSYINFGSGASLDELGSTSITMWIRPQYYTSNQPLLYKGDGLNNDIGRWLGFYSAGGGGPSHYLEFAKVYLNLNLRAKIQTYPSAGSWYHLGMTWSGGQNPGTVSFYVDGVSIPLTATTTSQTGVGTITTDAPYDLILGKNVVGGGPSGQFNGLIDDLRIYNKVLSQPEIVSDMNTAL